MTYNPRSFLPKFWTSFTLLILIFFSACVPPSAPLGSGAAQQPTSTTAPTLMVPPIEQALIFRSQAGAQKVEIVRIDLITGKPVEGDEIIQLSRWINYAFSPDRTRLGLVARNADCPDACLYVFSLPDLEQLARVELPEMAGADDWVHPVRI